MIKLWDNLMVDADKDNYIVGELRIVNVKKDTEIVQEQRIFNPKYFYTFENVLQYALETVIKRCVHDADIERAESFAEEVQKARQEIKDALEKLGMGDKE